MQAQQAKILVDYKNRICAYKSYLDQFTIFYCLM